MKLSILIPTYNRSKYLLKNLELLTQYIQRGNYSKEVEIIVSNNHSSDETHQIVTKFQNGASKFQFKYFSQDTNIGLEQNALFVLKEAKGDYVMYLGDDDYIEYEYLQHSLDYLNNYPNVFVILPNFIPINVEGLQLGQGRDDKLPNKLYKSGFRNCLTNSWRGHQLSGLFLKRENLYETYLEKKVSNLYPFIFFVGYSCLHGDTYHLTEFPVKVTVTGQNNKDWNYSEDGLISEIFDNYKKMFSNKYFRMSLIQLNLLRIQYFRYWNYMPNSYCNPSKSYRPFFLCVKKIILSDKTSLITSFLFPTLVLSRLFKNKFHYFFTTIKTKYTQIINESINKNNFGKNI